MFLFVFFNQPGPSEFTVLSILLLFVLDVTKTIMTGWYGWVYAKLMRLAGTSNVRYVVFAFFHFPGYTMPVVMSEG